jgi:ribonuclease HII
MDHFERQAYEEGFRLIAGVDEAGRGPLAGPVVAAAVALPLGFKNQEIRDSKELTPRKREKLYDVITQEARMIGLGVIEPAVIDSINILRASLMAMEEAVYNLSLLPDYLLIDGIHPLKMMIPQRTVIRGDALSLSMACASIIAKVSRDRIMEIYHKQFPQYNFIKNKGYGTKEHLQAIRNHGLCKIHRRSFKPVRECLD